MSNTNALVLDFFDMQKVGELGYFRDQLLSGNLPDFVKEATLDYPSKADEFAIILNGVPKFPIDNPANTYLSKVAFEINKDKLSPTAQDVVAFWITKAAEVYGLDFDLQPKNSYSTNKFYREPDVLANLRKESIEKQAKAEKEVEKSYALDVNGNKMFPLNDREQVEQAKVAFEKGYKRLPPIKRHEMAQRIFDKCAEMNIDVKGSPIMAYAGTEFSPFLSQRLNIRKKYLNKRASRVLENLYDNKDRFGPMGFAKILYEFDKAANLNKLGTSIIPDAYYTVFADPSSIDKVSFRLNTEYGVVTAEKLQKLANSEKLGNLFGDEFTEEFSSSPVQTFSSLPDEEKSILIDVMRYEGVL